MINYKGLSLGLLLVGAIGALQAEGGDVVRVVKKCDKPWVLMFPSSMKPAQPGDSLVRIKVEQVSPVTEEAAVVVGEDDYVLDIEAERAQASYDMGPRSVVLNGKGTFNIVGLTIPFGGKSGKKEGTIQLQPKDLMRGDTVYKIYTDGENVFVHTRQSGILSRDKNPKPVQTLGMGDKIVIIERGGKLVLKNAIGYEDLYESEPVVRPVYRLLHPARVALDKPFAPNA